MASPTRPVTEIQIGGIAYRVQSSADTSELARLAALVEARLADLPPSQRQDHRSLVLVALALAHDLEQERARHAALRASVAQRLTGLVDRIDEALDHRDENGEPLPQLARIEARAAAQLHEPPASHQIDTTEPSPLLTSQPGATTSAREPSPPQSQPAVRNRRSPAKVLSAKTTPTEISRERDD